MARSLVGFQAITLLVRLFSGYVLFRAMLSRERGSAILALGFAVFFGAAINDILVSNNVVHGTFVVQFGLLAFLFSMSIVITRKFAAAFSRAEALGVELARTNSSLRGFNSRLEEEVASRTAGLADLNHALSVEVQERKEKERLLAVSLSEKEVLLKEVNHRVKNNLQIIASIINMQIAGLDNPQCENILATVRNRIFSIARVHELLYGSGNVSNIDTGDYFHVLVTEIVMAYQRPGLTVETDVEASGIVFAVERAMPIGLIVGELVSNSMKHGFVGRERGRIEVSLRRDGNRFELRISDDGVGLEDGAASRSVESGSIGFLLVDALASQLGSRLRRETAGRPGLYPRFSLTTAIRSGCDEDRRDSSRRLPPRRRRHRLYGFQGARGIVPLRRRLGPLSESPAVQGFRPSSLSALPWAMSSRSDGLSGAVSSSFLPAPLGL